MFPITHRAARQKGHVSERAIPRIVIAVCSRICSSAATACSCSMPVVPRPFGGLTKASAAPFVTLDDGWPVGSHVVKSAKVSVDGNRDPPADSHPDLSPVFSLSPSVAALAREAGFNDTRSADVRGCWLEADHDAGPPDWRLCARSILPVRCLVMLVCPGRWT